MELYKNIDVAKEFNVSAVTILNWIEGSINGKNTLQLHTRKDKQKIVKSDHNRAELARLAANAMGFKNANRLKHCIPDPSIYDLFTEDQLLEIITDLERYGRFQHKFAFAESKHWDEFYNNNHAIASTSDEPLELNMSVFKYFFSKGQKISLIDFGCGNGDPSISILNHLTKTFDVNEYISVDISEKMNKLCQLNIQKKYPAIDTNYHTLDFERASLNQLILTRVNPSLILLSGGTLTNLENPDIALKNISRSMKVDDLFSISFSLNNEVSRAMLQYVNNERGDNLLFWFFKQIGVDIDLCKYELQYTERKCRQKSIILDKDYDIEFYFNGFKKIIRLIKGQKIIAWRHYLHTEKEFIDLIDECGLKLCNLTVDKNGWSALAVCKIKEAPVEIKLGA